MAAACLAALARGGSSQKHRIAAIEQDVNRQVALLLEEAEEKFSAALIEIPVDAPDVIAGHVGAEVAELHPRAHLRGAMLGMTTAARHLAGGQAHPRDGGDEICWKQFGHQSDNSLMDLTISRISSSGWMCSE